MPLSRRLRRGADTPFIPRLFLLAVLLAACAGPGTTSSPPPAPSLGGPPPHVFGNITAGPVCPVEQSPSDPACAPRPVAGAVIVAIDTSGQTFGRATTAVDGSYQIIVGATGTFRIEGLPVAGLMGVPAPVTVTLPYPGTSANADLQYDTGIR